MTCNKINDVVTRHILSGVDCDCDCIPFVRDVQKTFYDARCT